MNASVQELLDLEWQLFDDAPQAGQRSARLEDRDLFTITRSSRLATWTPELRESWWQDLQAAQIEGRNLVNEKYIYMLEQREPEQYRTLKSQLPKPNLEKLWLVDWICQAEIAWQEILVGKYPRLMKNSRSIHNAAGQQEASFETFLRGELMTCSVNTLRLYARQVEHAQKAGENLCQTVLENTVQQFGFASLDEAEMGLQKKMQL